MIGEKIRLRRLQLNLSMNKLAQLVGVSLNTVFRWEREEREPGFESIKKLCDALEVSHDYFFENEKPPESRNVPRFSFGTGAHDGIRPQSFANVVMIPVFAYSRLGDDKLKTLGYIPVQKDKLLPEDGAADEFFLIEQDIPFRMELTGPIPQKYMALMLKDTRFEDGMIYLISLGGRQVIRRVRKSLDGSVTISCDGETVSLSPEEQESQNFKIMARCTDALKTDWVKLG